MSSSDVKTENGGRVEAPQTASRRWLSPKTTAGRVLLFIVNCLLLVVLVFAFRMLAFTVYTVDGYGLSPQFKAGDRVLVNRWSYGLRVGGDKSVFDYGRLCRRQIKKGDIVAFEDPRQKNGSKVLLCRCKAVPGDTVNMNGKTMVVPGLKDCADADYYWLEALGEGNPTDSRQLGFIPEKQIIGRACLIVYSHQPGASLFKGWRQRFMLPL